MSSLVDLRVLVLAGDTRSARARADLDLLARRTTCHVLSVGARTLPVTLLRLAKRALLGQDDAVVLYRLPRPLMFPLLILARLSGVPAISTSGGRGDTTLKRLASLAGRSWPDAGVEPVRVDLGCGSQKRPGFIGIDARRTPATAIVADARAVPVASTSADEVYASCLLEHFDDPHEVLREIHRMLKPAGQAVLRLPNLGTYSSHLDLTHRFLADLALWRRILSGYFEEVRVLPVGTKYRDNAWLVRVNWLLVNLLKWYELAQGWDFVCRRPKDRPGVEYVAWWEE